MKLHISYTIASQNDSLFEALQLDHVSRIIWFRLDFEACVVIIWFRSGLRRMYHYSDWDLSVYHEFMNPLIQIGNSEHVFRNIWFKSELQSVYRE